MNNIKKKDQILLEQAYQNVYMGTLIVEGFDIKSILSKAVNFIKNKFPDLFKQLISINSVEELKSFLKVKNVQKESLNEGIMDELKKLYSAGTPQAALALLGILVGKLGLIYSQLQVGYPDPGTDIGVPATSAYILGILYMVIQALKDDFNSRDNHPPKV